MVVAAATQPRRQASEYETIYILRPNTDTASADKVSGRIVEVMDRLGGKLTLVDNWGKRRLAYPIAKHTRGIFVYVKYVGYNDLISELERNLRLLDSVIRYQTVVINKGVPIDGLDVDPESVKFVPIEVDEEEDEEEGLEQRLGLAPSRPQVAPAEAAAPAEGEAAAAPAEGEAAAAPAEGEAAAAPAEGEAAAAPAEGEAAAAAAPAEGDAPAENAEGDAAPAENAEAGDSEEN